MNDFDPYAVLGVPRDANEAAIKRGYRHRAKTAHPDAGGSTEEFVPLERALAILLDPLRRRAYDETGNTDDPGPDNDRAKALQIIESFVEGVVAEYVNSSFQSPDPCTTDLVALFRKRMAIDLRGLHENIAVGQHVLKWMRRLRGKFSTTDKVDVIARGFDARIRRCEQQIADQKAAIKIRNDALEIMKKYKFSPDPASSFSTFTISIG